MNRTEQKEALTDIIEKVENFIGDIDEKRPYVEDVCAKIDDLHAELIEGIDFDADQLKGNVLVTVLEMETSFSEVYEALDDFRNEIDDVMGDMNPETKRYEAMEERYMDLEEVCDWFNDANEFAEDSLDYVEEKAREAIDYLKGMKK